MPATTQRAEPWLAWLLRSDTELLRYEDDMAARKRFTPCTLFAATMVLAVGLLSPPAVHKAAARHLRCRFLVPGTYLITVNASGGNFSSRSLVTFTSAGNLLVVDSNQDGVEGEFNPFSDQQGAWKCTGRRAITARTLDFTFVGSVSDTKGIARLDYTATFDWGFRTLTGQVTLRLFPLDGNPFDDTVLPVETLPFSGQRVTAD
jgi:hypothetical protein